MKSKRFLCSVGTAFAGLIGVAGASYAAYVGITWFGYGKPKASAETADPLLDRFMPEYEVVDRHKTRVAAPAEIALSAAMETDLEGCAVIRGVFKGREWILRSKPDNTIRPTGLLAQAKWMGWGILAERPGREIVMGAATKPWEPNPVFRALPPDEFAAFHEPEYVKIVWTLRADPVGSNESVLRTETRAMTTDPESRRRFRWYWSLFSPGIILIRRTMLPAVKAEAERRWGAIAA